MNSLPVNYSDEVQIGRRKTILTADRPKGALINSNQYLPPFMISIRKHLAVMCFSLSLAATAFAGQGSDILPNLNWDAEESADSAVVTHQAADISSLNGQATDVTHFAAYSEFRDNKSHSALLDARVRNEGAVVSIAFGGKPSNDPSSSPTLAVDGAAVAFKEVKNVEGGNLVQVVAQSRDSADNPFWLPLNVMIAPHKDGSVHRGPTIEIRFHPSARTFDVLCHGHLLKAGLKLPATASACPCVQVSGGLAEQPFLLMHLSIKE